MGSNFENKLSLSDMDELLLKLKPFGQDHLLQFCDRIKADEKKKFEKDLSEVDYAYVKKEFETCQKELEGQQNTKKDDAMEAVADDDVCRRASAKPEEIKRWSDLGLKEISKGHVGLLLMAGGQGTRLGVPYPKGMYNVNLPSQKTLYQLQAERLLSLQRTVKKQYGTDSKIRWYIMTSDATQEATEAFFEKNNYFGLDKADIVLFPQHLFPCLTFEGKMMLDRHGKIAKSPDGNGGLYRAMKTWGITDDMAKHGVEYVFAYCVDNILVRVADPVFMGYCAEKGVECANKVVEKTDPSEAVGVTCKYKGKYGVVEYSEMSSETAHLRKSDGSLKFCSGNICNHFFTRQFLEDVIENHLDDFPRHIAKKKIPYINDEGERITPDKPNGIKLEKFVFDVFQFAKKFAIYEVHREDEFSPLKNATGGSSPQTSRADLMSLHRRQIEAAGGRFVDEEGKEVDSSTAVECEISPLLSYAGENLEDVVKGKTFVASQPTHLQLEENDSDSSNDSNGPSTEKKPRSDDS